MGWYGLGTEGVLGARAHRGVGGLADRTRRPQGGVSNMPLTWTDIGLIVLAEVGTEVCASDYGTTDPAWVGRYAVVFGDANEDGTLN